VDSGVLWVFGAMSVVSLLLSIASIVGLDGSHLTRREEIRVRLRRRGLGLLAELDPRPLQGRRAKDHGVAWLDANDVGQSGDPLWFEEAPPLRPLRIVFLPRPDRYRSSPSSGLERVLDVGPGEGVAAWLRWDAGVDTNSLVILWTAKRRAQGKRPLVLRGDRANEWLPTLQGKAPPPRVLTALERVRASLTGLASRASTKGSGGSVSMPYASLDVSGLRGFGSQETVELAIPNGRAGSGLTVLVGANNSGKSSVVEAFDAVYRATRQPAVSFAADRRHGGEQREVRIRLNRVDGRSVGVETLRPGTSEARVVWDDDRNSIDRIPIEVTVLPSRRQFAAHFSRHGEADRGWASTGASEFSRSQNRDGFVARLFSLHSDEARLRTFNSLLHRVTGRYLTWSIDLGAQQQYFLRFTEDGAGSHTSDGLGDGLISLLFILDALHDSTTASLIVIDEPELSLHPQYVARLGALLAEYAATRQIVFATHSPVLVDWTHIANGARVARIYKEGGRSIVAEPRQATLAAIAAGHLSNTQNPHVFGPRGNEVFFQEERLIVLEGQEDVVYLPAVLSSTGISLDGSIFGWGAGGAARVASVLSLLRELGFRRVAVLLDGDEQTMRIKSTLRSEFPEYCIESHPADDIRTKKAQPPRPLKAGLLADDGLSVRPEHMLDTSTMLKRINDYLRREPILAPHSDS
jgi:5S rRNA maturation endonuclease (ribonuclease M5)